ncbi:hypothetical protein [Lacisediminimonas profundi]|uniref:hypothetical protein n=1 Tax=Lacisediminimonas profundi TaxID=2603856 RepID=UPI00124AFE4D|nr:hypothetical protein [Lacisediminimonas profundi]
MTKEPDTGDSERQCRPVASIALRTGGAICAMILGGLSIASCSSSVADASTANAAQASTEIKTAAATLFIPERLDHTVVNQHSTAHDSDLPGASIGEK